MSNVVINFEGVNHFALAPPSFCFVHSLSFYPLFVYLFFSWIDCCCSILLFFFWNGLLCLRWENRERKRKNSKITNRKKRHMKAFLTSLFNAIPYFHQFDINYSSPFINPSPYREYSTCDFTFSSSSLLWMEEFLSLLLLLQQEWLSLSSLTSWIRRRTKGRQKKLNKLQLFNILFPLWKYVGCRATPTPQ